MQNHSFQLLVDGVPYNVKATPFSFNEGVRFRVHFNESPEFIFAWDESASQYTAIDHDSTEISSNVETAIAAKLSRLQVKVS